VPSNLSVKVTADVVDMQTKFAVARAETQSLSSELNKLARASASGTIDSAGQARMQQLAADLLQAKTQAQGYSAALAAAGFSASGFSRSSEEMHGSISTATREFRALFDELSSGRTRMTPGTLAIIAQRVLGLSPAALGALAGVTALVGGLAYLTYRSIETAEAIDKAAASARFFGNLDISSTSVKEFTDEIERAGVISASSATKIAETLGRVPGMTSQMMSALAPAVSQYMQVTGEAADKAAESLAKFFEPRESAQTLAQTLNLSQEMINAARAADQSGNANEIAAEKITLLDAALQSARPLLAQHAQGWLESARSALIYFADVSAGTSVAQVSSDLTAERTARINQEAQAIRERSSALMATPPDPNQTLKTGVEVAQKENPVSQQAEEARSKIAEMTAALAVAKQQGDQLSIDKLNAGLDKARTELSSLQFGPVIERMREQMSELASTWDGTQAGLLAKQQAVAQATLAQVSSSAKDRLEVESEIARLEVQVRQAAGSQAISQAREQVSQISAATSQGATQRLAAEAEVWRTLLAGDSLTAAQRIEVQRSLNQSIAELNRERASESSAIARQDVDTDISIARTKVEAEKQTLQASIANEQGVAAAKYALLRNLTQQEYALDLQRLQNELDTLKQLPVEYDRVFNQIRELKAKEVLDLAQLDREAAEASRKAAQQDAAGWKSAVNEIEGAESTLVSDLISRRRSLSQSLLQISSQLVTKEIADDIKAMTTRILLADTAQTQQKALEQGGFLYHLLMSNQATAATAASQQAQTAAVVTGNAARTAATASGAAASKAASTAAGAQTVLADAAKAFSGTYASVAQIPYVGWILAPAAAAAAFAAVAAYQSLASLDVGAWSVPQDMVAQIHQGEMVVPATFAEGIRQSGSLSGAGLASGIGGGGDTHNWNISLQAHDLTGLKSWLQSPDGRGSIVRAIGSHFGRGGRG